MNRIKKLSAVFKKELMLSVSLIAALVSLFITKPDMELLHGIDWKTLATLFMLLTVLEGFKKENIFAPVLRLTSGIKSMRRLTCFFVYGVFILSEFVTNDVSLIIFVPLTIIMFRSGGKEKYIIPVLTLENIAAIRGSLLTPFGSPQNLFLFTQSGVPASSFMIHMFPLWISSIILLYVFILFLYRKDEREQILTSGTAFIQEWQNDSRLKRFLYLFLFCLVIFTIVSRTEFWPYITAFVFFVILFFDGKILLKTDYVLLLTFTCFFIFSSSISRNPAIKVFLEKAVSNHEYVWSILLSQVISNVPASIVLWPFSRNLTALLYGLDSAGLCSIIGSLASVINLRIYSREYPGRALEFMKIFEIISMIFFLIIVVPQYFLCSWHF